MASGLHPGLNEKSSAICEVKYGWWLLVYNSPRGLESLVPAVFWDPPPPHRILYISMWRFGQIHSTFVAQWPYLHCIFLKNKIIFWNFCSYLWSVAVLLCVRCKCGILATTRPLAKTIVTIRCSLGDFLRKTKSFGSVWAKDCEESSEGRIE